MSNSRFSARGLVATAMMRNEKLSLFDMLYILNMNHIKTRASNNFSTDDDICWQIVKTTQMSHCIKKSIEHFPS